MAELYATFIIMFLTVNIHLKLRITVFALPQNELFSHQRELIIFHRAPYVAPPLSQNGQTKHLLYRGTFMFLVVTAGKGEG